MRIHIIIVTILSAAQAATAQPERSPHVQRGLAQAVDPTCAAGALPLADLEHQPEDRLLAADRRPAIVPIADADGRVHPEREPLLLVHGIEADFDHLGAIARRAAALGRYQEYVVAYADVKRHTAANGDDLAGLLVERFAGRRLTFVAHSMGGIVVRRALDRLVLDGRIAEFPRVRVLAVDTPWHGYGGPPDGFRMSFVRPFMPDGYEDMRARSPMFQGDARKEDPLDQVGLYGVDLPANVEVSLIGATEGDTALDDTELPGVAAQLALRLDLEPFSDGVDQRVKNLVAALAQSELGRTILREEVPLTPRCVQEALTRLWPKLAGDHSGVMHGEPFLQAAARYLSN